MTTTVYVDVPKDVEWSAEVTTVERKVGGEVRASWIDTVKAGESRYFHVHDGASIVVAEKAGADGDGHAGLVAVFAFALRQPVELVGSDERGTVIARAEYAENGRSYLVRYRAADGRLTEAWWNEPALVAIGTPAAPDTSTEEAEELPASAAKSDPALPVGTEAPALQA